MQKKKILEETDESHLDDKDLKSQTKILLKNVVHLTKLFSRIEITILSCFDFSFQHRISVPYAFN